MGKNHANIEDIPLVIGIDFGTLSARAVIVRSDNGAVLGEAVSEYRHGVMDGQLTAADGQELPPDYALQVPSDYLASLVESVTGAVKDSGVDAQQIVGMGLDCTSSTVVVTDGEGKPLCEDPAFTHEPHAYIKLWKHHGGNEQAARIVQLAKERNEPWLKRFGGTLSSEMLLPKALETLEKAPEVYYAAEEILDVLDWLTWQLTGRLAYSASDSGYKRIYYDGVYPSHEFLGQLNPDFADVYSSKMSHEVLDLGQSVGGLTKDFSQKLGLPEGIAVAVGNIDAHVHAASVGAVEPGQLTGIIGTSTCWVLPAQTLELVPGVFGVVDGGISDGTWGYEAGQSAVGDMFAWFVDNCVPEKYRQEARSRGISVHDLLTEKASVQEVGEHGLIALDWWNGNRSILVDADLTGLMIGQTLATKPEDQYRALLEATAFGARVIIENFENHGVPVKEIRIAGGLLKNPLLMQMYADITRRPLAIATVENAGAHGSAVFAAIAAGIYPDLRSACEHMSEIHHDAYLPREEVSHQYDQLFALYQELYDYFGRGSEAMHQLKRLRREARIRSVGHGNIPSK
ncbi:ribulokinase [Actinomycetaceae bacterium WB03_NA08]|uniref:Ribulokinase n=1 Tax=Scrofimicrobium canadense TaxID=2652290 RepID=A0A6N7VWT3_9ACTO|nr:ribulokinase [Scrofimicrobium canadense]MSS85450.1 ribulokinase [Scrofimicrobium canadense]